VEFDLVAGDKPIEMAPLVTLDEQLVRWLADDRP
jgi:hypothetical protein